MKPKKTMITITMVIFLSVCAFQTNGFAWFKTGKELARDMQSYQEFLYKKKNKKKGKIPNFFKMGYFMGYVTAVFDDGRNTSFFPPRKITNGQVFSIVVRYIEAHPERYNESANQLVLDALIEAFPKKKSP